MMIGLSIGLVVGGLVGAIGGDRDWSLLKTLVIANLISLPLVTLVLLARAA